MNKWRPEEWQVYDTTEIYNSGHIGYNREAVKSAYEAGADAMLEAVCKEIKKVMPSVSAYAPEPDDKYGRGKSTGFEEFRQRILNLLGAD